MLSTSHDKYSLQRWKADPIVNRKKAGTWINMQDAYFQEKGQVGNWVKIGYSGPGQKHNGSSYSSNVFQYEGEETCGGTTTTACTWVATPKTKLNDCLTSMHWQLDATNTGTPVDDMYPNFVIATNNSTDAECLALTASWESLTGSH